MLSVRSTSARLNAAISPSMRERAIDSSPASFTKRSIMSAFTRSSAARALAQLRRQRVALRDFLRGRGRDHRERGGLVLLLLEHRADRHLDRLGLDDVLAARQPLEGEREAVDALLDLVELRRPAAMRPRRSR